MKVRITCICVVEIGGADAKHPDPISNLNQDNGERAFYWMGIAEKFATPGSKFICVAENVNPIKKP